MNNLFKIEFLINNFKGSFILSTSASAPGGQSILPFNIVVINDDNP